jgi:uncharacterized protein (TIGR02147 family)
MPNITRSEHTSGFTPIYDYQNPRQFLLDRVSALQKRDAAVSVRALAKQMGLKSHTLLVLLLQGKRPLRVKHAPALAKGLGLTSSERLYLQALIQFDSAADIEEKKLCSLWLADLHPEGVVRSRRLDEFEAVSSWIHMAILAACELADLETTPEAIAHRFKNKVTPTEVRAALERLKALKLLEMTDSGRLRPSVEHVTTSDDIANAGARKYHREVLALAEQAIEGVALDKREFQSFAITIPQARVGLAKEMIRKFRTQLENAVGVGGPGSEVYQTSIQLFQLTENPLRISRTEDEGVVESASIKKGNMYV